jgi:hypothetical protein
MQARPCKPPDKKPGTIINQRAALDDGARRSIPSPDKPMRDLLADEGYDPESKRHFRRKCS